MHILQHRDTQFIQYFVLTWWMFLMNEESWSCDKYVVHIPAEREQVQQCINIIQ